MQVILATRNLGKVREIQYLADNANLPKDFNLEFLSIPATVPDIAEPFSSYVENALYKAREVAKHTELPVIAEDSGINLPALGGAPGIYSARYSVDANIKNADDKKNNQKLLAELSKAEKLNLNNINLRHAYYFCACVFIQNPKDQHPLITQGIWHGEISKTEIGSGGFGYDPIFLLPNFNKTSAQLTLEEKCKISHRAIALNKMFVEIFELVHKN